MPGVAKRSLCFHRFPERDRSPQRLWTMPHGLPVSYGRGHFVHGAPDTRRPSPVPPMRTGKDGGSRLLRRQSDSDGQTRRPGRDPSTGLVSERGDLCAGVSVVMIQAAALFECAPTRLSFGVGTGARVPPDLYARQSEVPCQFERPQSPKAFRNNIVVPHCVQRQLSFGVLER